MVESERARVLIVDDEKSMRELLTIALEPEGHQVRAVPSVPAARHALAREPFDLVVSDIAMPGETGLDLLADVRQNNPELPVILITAYASMDSAKRAFALGVYDCIDKGASFNVDEFRATVRNALDSHRARQENQLLRQQLRSQHGPGTMVAASPKMRTVCNLIERVAPTPSTVLITGESGTGKEIVARTIHYSSPRAEAPFVSINCGALPSELLESELFGHVKGAFTGAIAAKKGLFQVARGGTVFLDEIGEMPPPAQVRLLRVLQERTIRMVGGTEEIPVDARVIAATNADLAARVAGSSFREDLFYRINVIPIALPPLRERREDIPILAELFAQRFSEEMGRALVGFTPEAMRALEAYQWPGNVRELENCVQRAMTLSAGERVAVEALPAEIGGPAAAASRPPPVAAPHLEGEMLLPEGENVDRYLDHIKAGLMTRALEESNYIQVEAARRLGMSFRSFRYFVKQYNLEVRPHRKRTGQSDGSEG
jgi:DNA-binding NtrC family response regulator